MARRSLGQHFLQAPDVIERILQAANPRPGERILEIGPGQGVLTYPMSLSGASVIAVEVDEHLARKLKPSSRLVVVKQDILQVDLPQLLPDPPYKVVANLPYYITTPILEKLLSQGYGLLDELWLMMQHEVAERIVSEANRLSGSLTHFVRYYAKSEYLFRVPPRAFLPPPSVDSAVVYFKLHQPPSNCQAVHFFRILRQAFAQRRKMLRSSLKGLVNEQQFALASIESHRRPETLRFEDFLSLERCSRVMPDSSKN